MSTVFIGGSRHVSQLPDEVRTRLYNVICRGHSVVVGDAPGVDKAVRAYFLDAAYDKVTVFCSGRRVRNNMGQWAVRKIDAPKHLKGFHFYAVKDREMAREADFGLMIWDGRSIGTVLNVLRLVGAGKIAVLFNVPERYAINIKTPSDWGVFLRRCSAPFRRQLLERAMPEEWRCTRQVDLIDGAEHARDQTGADGRAVDDR